jgi:hypothetical protein
MYDITLIIGIAGLIASIISVIISLWIFRRARPLYYWQFSKLEGVKHPDIKISFGSRQVSNLYSVRLVFWNGGRSEIRRKDIPEGKAAPRIKVTNNCEILSHSAKSTTYDNTGKFIELNKQELSLDFDYLNPKDALLGEAHLTTDDDIKPDIKFLGTLKGLEVSEGEIVNISIMDNIMASILNILILFTTIYMGLSLYSTIISNQGFLFLKSVRFLFFLALTILFFQANILTIPKKIPQKYLNFIKTGEFKINP